MAITDLVLLTGSTGFIGFRTLRYALEKGYTVRAAVRSESKADAVRNNPALSNVKDLSLKLSFAIVPDILAKGAFDEAIKSVKYVVHLASPLASNVPEGVDWDDFFVEPAVRGTISILEAAAKESGVERVVITSSAVAILSTPALTGQGDHGKTFSADDRAGDIPHPYPAPIIAYVQSKIAALRQGEKWVADNNPKFDVVHIAPSFVGGRNDTADNVKDLLTGTNFYFIAPVLGEEAAKQAGPRVMAIVSVDDVAKAHIESLNDSVGGNEVFLLTNAGGDAEWNDAKKIVEKRFPEQVKNGTLPNNGSIEPHFIAKTDIAKTEKTFGKLASYEEIIVALVGQYLELQGKTGQKL